MAHPHAHVRTWTAQSLSLLLAILIPHIMAANTTATPTPTTAPAPSPASATRTCVPLPPTSICSSVLSYTSVSVDHSTVNASCVGTPYADTTDWMESQISSTFPGYWASLQEPCRSNMASFMCQQVYPPCGGVPPCDTRCLGTASSCSSVDANLIYPTIMPSVVKSPVIPTQASCAAFSKPPNGTTCVAEPNGYVSQPGYPRCETYTGSICAGVISYPIYVPRNMTQDVIESQLAGLVKLRGLAKVANGCLNSFVTVYCLTAFPRCDDGVITSPVAIKTPFPQLACRSVCTDFYDKCSDSVIPFIPQNHLPNCTSQGTVAPGPTYVCGIKMSDALDDYPVTQSTFGVIHSSFGNIPLTTQCNSLSSTQVQSLSINVTCPAPLVSELITDMSQISIIVPGAMCNLPCNEHIQFSDAEWVTFGRYSVGLSVVSFILGSFLFWTWLCIPSKRKQRNTLYFNFCVMMLSFFVLVGFFSGREPKNVGCKTAAQSYNQDDGGYCPFQGVSTYYFAFAGIWWWTFIAIDLFIAILVLPKRTDRQATLISRTYHAIAWGIPLLCVIIISSHQGFGGTIVQTFCWIGNKAPSYDIWAFFVIPFFVLVCIGFSCIISIMVVMARSSSNSKLRRNWKKYIRPGLFMVQFGVIIVIVFSFYVVTLHIEFSGYVQSQIQFVGCLFSPDGNQSNCGVDGHQAFRISPSWWYAGHFTMMGQGLVNFITYGTQWSNLVEWKKLIIAVLTGAGMSYQTSQDNPSSHKTNDPSNKSNKGDKSARSHISTYGDGSSVPNTARGEDPHKATISSDAASPHRGRQYTESRTPRLGAASSSPGLHSIEMSGAHDVPGRIGPSVSGMEAGAAADSDSIADMSLSHAPALIHHGMVPSSSISTLSDYTIPHQPTPSPRANVTATTAHAAAPRAKTSKALPPLPPTYPPPGRASAGSAINFV